MFYIIGLGLSDEKDITLRGLEVRATRWLLKPPTRPSNIQLPPGDQELHPCLPRSVH